MQDAPRKPGRAPPRCPICGQPTQDKHRPFCSRRCADVDLARWLNGAYFVPGSGADADEDGDAAPHIAPEPPGTTEPPGKQ